MNLEAGEVGKDTIQSSPVVCPGHGRGSWYLCSGLCGSPVFPLWTLGIL